MINQSQVVSRDSDFNLLPGHAGSTTIFLGEFSFTFEKLAGNSYRVSAGDEGVFNSIDFELANTEFVDVRMRFDLFDERRRLWINDNLVVDIPKPVGTFVDLTKQWEQSISVLFVNYVITADFDELTFSGFVPLLCNGLTVDVDLNQGH